MHTVLYLNFLHTVHCLCTVHSLHTAQCLP